LPGPRALIHRCLDPREQFGHSLHFVKYRTRARKLQQKSGGVVQM